MLAEGCNYLKDALLEEITKATGRRVNHMALGYMQRGGNPTMADRVLAARLSQRAVELIMCGQSGRVVGIRGGDIYDLAVLEALKIPKEFDEKLYDLAKVISK